MAEDPLSACLTQLADDLFSDSQRGRVMEPLAIHAAAGMIKAFAVECETMEIMIAEAGLDKHALVSDPVAADEKPTAEIHIFPRRSRAVVPGWTPPQGAA